jgi:hypothetical protein
VVDKQDWPKPAAWAITQNESLWQEFDSIADRSIIIEWSLSDNYRTAKMDPGDRAVFWITGRNGGLARVGFVLKVTPTPRGFWKDAHGRRHKSPFSGQFYLPPFPNRRYIHRSVFVGKPAMSDCELLGTAAQSQPPLRIEPKEWTVIQRQLLRFDRTNYDFRSPWHG